MSVVKNGDILKDSLIREFWGNFTQNKGALIGFYLLALIIILALFAPWISPYDPIEQFREFRLTPPIWYQGGSSQFILGTDEAGRDLLSRLIHGARLSLFIAMVAILMAFSLGVVLGLLAAFYPKYLGSIIMRIVDIKMALPTLLLAVAIMAILGQGLFNAMIAIAIAALPAFVRLTRATALSEISKEYVNASRIAGAGDFRLMFFTVLPNCISPLIIQMTLSFSSAILEIAALGFLSLGVEPPLAEWGTMLSSARDYMLTASWVVTLPGLMILITVISINLIGDGLRDALDPKLKQIQLPLQKKVEANQPLLSIKNLSIFFGEQDSFIKAVNQIDLTVNEGEIVGIVGESGSGKSVTMMAVMGLLGTKSMVLADYLRFRGQNLMKMTPSQKRKIVGKEMAMIFQDPMTSLNPTYTVGRQLMEVLEIHQGLRGSTLRSKAVELLKLVEIPSAEKRISQYPHELSGGMCQRVAIAMAIACQPKLLIADEPTTALDVTIQAQIMELLVSLQKKFNMSLILITHDLAVVAEIADRAIVMYSGEIVEEAELPQLFESPKHPYTEALLKAIPEHNEGISRLAALPGIVPPLNNRPVGCLLAERCAYAKPLCYSEHPNLNPLLITSKASNILNNKVRCFFPLAEKISFVEEITHAS